MRCWRYVRVWPSRALVRQRPVFAHPCVTDTPAIRAWHQEFVREAASMLPFLKSVECIEVLEFPATAGPADSPHLLFSCGIHPPTLSRELRAQRAFVKGHPTMGRVARVDFELVIQAKLTERGQRTLAPAHVEEVSATEGGAGTGAGAGAGAGAGGSGAASRTELVTVERWLVCNQWCGDGLDERFFGAGTAHLRLVPWAGVAALLARGAAGTPDGVVGAAYCSLPLPIHTGLPVHVRPPLSVVHVCRAQLTPDLALCAPQPAGEWTL